LPDLLFSYRKLGFIGSDFLTYTKYKVFFQKESQNKLEKKSNKNNNSDYVLFLKLINYLSNQGRYMQVQQQQQEKNYPLL
jgi:hypothetical protein